VRRIPRRSASRDAPVYQARTRDILVRVVASFALEQSDPDAGEFVWIYTVEIENHGKETVELTSHRWVVVDAMNRAEETVEDGVAGEQPELRPGEAFRYSQTAELRTRSGSMRGAFHLVTDHGETFDAEIPEFSLHLPGAGRVVN
jgi:ApaG protein